MNVKNELGCENCERCCEMSIIHAQRKFVRGTCLKNKKVFFKPLRFLLIERLQEIEFENKLVGVVYDRFGADIPIIKSDEEHFICHVKVAVSPHFLSWIMSFGKQAKILSPEYVIEEMYQLARDITDIYEKC